MNNQCVTFHEHVCEAITQEGVRAGKIFKAMHKAGIHGVVLDYNRLKAEPKWEKLFHKYDIAVSSMYYTFDFGYRSQDALMKEYIDTAARLHCPQVLCIPGFFRPEEKLERSTVFHNMCCEIRKMVEYAATQNIIVSMEDFDGEAAIFTTSEELMDFVKAVPGLGIAYDSGNFYFRGEDELEAFENVKEHITYVHLKDRATNPNDGSPATMGTGDVVYPCPVGSGVINMAEVIKRLQAIGYKGDLAMEHFGSAHQLSDMIESIRFIRNA